MEVGLRTSTLQVLQRTRTYRTWRSPAAVRGCNRYISDAAVDWLVYNLSGGCNRSHVQPPDPAKDPIQSVVDEGGLFAQWS